MFVCVCKAVTDREVKRVIEAGACTVAEVTRQCGAGGDCGACRGMIEEMIESSAAHEGDLVPAAALVRVKAA
jgi:bacterioferritin-associated ferredoxin